jgi:glucose-6-phosphate dehydrogenase assembly protein OpcA
VTDTALETPPLSDLGTEVPLSQVEKGLKQLFASDQAVTRASLMNFVIYSEQPDSLTKNTAILREVTREHACRAMLVAHTPCKQVPHVRCWITAHCNLAAGGRKSICSEQISFLMEGCGDYLVPNTIFSRLDSDLPLVFWWQGEFSENFESSLYRRIDRLIIDSGAWKNPEAQFDRLVTAYQESASHFNVMDLAWTRVLQLRMALAACFDDPMALAELPRVQEISITHAPNHGLEARMMAAWMAHQAGWKWIGQLGTDGLRWQLESKEGVSLTLNFSVQASAFPIAEIKLCGPEVTCQVIREASCPFLRSVITGRGQTLEHLTPATINSTADLIVERLRRGCNNRLYFTLLETVRKLIA